MDTDLRQLFLQLTAVPSSATEAAPAAFDIPCFQCGVCCEKWQPLLSPDEVRELAGALGMRTSAFSRRYTRAYPLRRGWRQFKAISGGCVFLGREGGRSFCTIYPIRPEVCRAWSANLRKRECVEGLGRLAAHDVLAVDELYAQAEERAQFITVAQDVTAERP
jgi:Fe-S-cluster containining protein